MKNSSETSSFQNSTKTIIPSGCTPTGVQCNCPGKEANEGRARDSMGTNRCNLARDVNETELRKFHEKSSPANQLFLQLSNNGFNLS